MTKFARDEFDRVPETSSRQGVHRAAADAPRHRLVPVLAVGVAALVIGLIAFLFLPQLGFSKGSTPLMAAGSSVSGASASPTAPQGTAASAPASSSPAPSASDAPGPTPSAGDGPSIAPEAAGQAVDKTQPVAVYNGTTTSGLASRVSGSVSAAGWALGPVGNWGGLPQSTSVIYYSGAAQKANAEALGSLLKITKLVDSAQFQMPVVVVLGPGFQ
jgi:hypothetical protein